MLIHFPIIIQEANNSFIIRAVLIVSLSVCGCLTDIKLRRFVRTYALQHIRAYTCCLVCLEPLAATLLFLCDFELKFCEKGKFQQH